MTLTRERRLRLILFLGVAIGAIAIAVTAYGIAFFQDFEDQTIDTRFTIRGDQGPPKDIVDVHVDDITFSDLNVRWPFNRTLHAALLDRICSANPKAAVFDVQFSEYATAREDNALGLAIQRCGKVTLSSTEVNARGEPKLVFDPQAMREIQARAGNGSFKHDHDGAIRHVNYTVDGLKALALVSAEVASHKSIDKGDMGGG